MQNTKQKPLSQRVGEAIRGFEGDLSLTNPKRAPMEKIIGRLNKEEQKLYARYQISDKKEFWDLMLESFQERHTEAKHFEKIGIFRDYQVAGQLKSSEEEEKKDNFYKHPPTDDAGRVLVNRYTFR